MAERVAAARQHLLDSVAWKGEKLGVLEMRRHYTPYLKGLPNIKDYRMKLVNIMEVDALLEVLAEVEEVYAGAELEMEMAG